MRDSRTLRDRYLAGIAEPAPSAKTDSTDSPGKDILSVTSLNRLAKSLLESNFPAVTVEGEISNLARPASGHWYFSLKDERSQLRCAMFANRNRLMRLRPENGQQLILRGRLSIYEGRGDYQLLCESMELAGDGALQRAFDELKRKLHAEGLFDDSHKQTLPPFPRHIGVVTSASGAAIRDIVSVFARRFPALQITLFPTAVQGEAAPAEIVRAIERAAEFSARDKLDALIVGRGGGSLEDLQAFNSEAVARAVHGCPLPVVSAVGHEIDFTICDFVADLRAPTPSAAAEQLSPSQMELAELFRGIERRVLRSMTEQLEQHGQRLDIVRRQLVHPGKRLLQIDKTLQQLKRRATLSLRGSLSERRLRLSQLARSLQAASPQSLLRQQSRELNNQQLRLRKALTHKLERSQTSLASLSRSLNAVSPLQTLARGYSISRDEQGKLLRSVKEVQQGDRLVTRLQDGEIRSTVQDSREFDPQGK